MRARACATQQEACDRYPCKLVFSLYSKFTFGQVLKGSDYLVFPEHYNLGESYEFI